MINSEDAKIIKEIIEDFFEKMTIKASVDLKTTTLDLEEILKDKEEVSKEAVDAAIRVDDPQILIGEKGQTLSEIQKILRFFINKKTGKFFYLNIDINDYKKKKIEYLRNLANDLADEAVSEKTAKILAPMSSYERRAIHEELSKRTDIKTESEGEEPERRVIIKPK